MKRQPSGTPVGGQFAPDRKPDGGDLEHIDYTMGITPDPEHDTEDDGFDDEVEITTFEHLGFPAATFSSLTHVGSLNESDKQAWSLEGDGLSVSTEPEAWEQIAQLGGNQWWTFEKDANKFLDAHELTDQQRAAINAWGVEAGYLVEAKGWRISWYDDEMEDTMSTILDSEEEARDELDDRESDEEPEEITRFVAGPNFPDSAGKDNADQVILSVWADKMTDFDGVWWNDDYDPDRYSAPRAVIFKSRLTEWSSSRTHR